MSANKRLGAKVIKIIRKGRKTNKGLRYFFPPKELSFTNI